MNWRALNKRMQTCVEQLTSNSKIRFLIVTGLNFCYTTIIYAALIWMSDNFVLAYACAFLFGMIYTADQSARFIFNARKTFTNLAIYGLYYSSYSAIALYSISMVVSHEIVPKYVALGFVSLFLAPINFLLCKQIFRSAATKVTQTGQ